ncbi:uncharacterized protein [Physcomitrium patens]|uniref:Uncharacterized protein n=1 Tax=Physcomitrium patens TaxID=3218 RepID=A0A7I4EG50_PHYPA|nr:uncharacterized protein LOC112283236 isoform X2 [Physcomitrium patens]|eukprot:XP_024377471.1 uncharacterized protein LOC112283236 isoform X2 [Physcomitrella patens]
MLRRKESVDNAPRMKMMHLMVNRRQVLNKKTSLVKETLNDGLVTFGLDSQESDSSKSRHRPRRNCKYATSESHSSSRFHGNEAAKVTADDPTGKFAYVSLDGRLINAELATSISSIGGKLGDQEAQAWEDFAPIQRVLIVALSAAAAAEAKHRNREEIDLLFKAVEKRENELILLRQQFSLLCKQNHTDTLQIHPEPLLLPENLVVSSPISPARRGLQTVRRSLNGDNINLSLDLKEDWISTEVAMMTPCVVGSEFRGCEDDARRLSRDNLVNKDVVFVESTPCKGKASTRFSVGDEAWAEEEAKWYVNPMVETTHDFYNISTPERCNSMYSICNPARQGSFEWKVLRSSFASRGTEIANRSNPLVNSPKMKFSNSSNQPRAQLAKDGAVVKDHKAMLAVCAAVVIDLRKQMLKILDEETSMVIDALDQSVEDAKTRVASMHVTLKSCLNASVPKALAGINLSPSEFDSSIFSETQGACNWNGASKTQESILAWNAYLGTNCGPEMPSAYEVEKIQKNSAEYLEEQLLRELDKTAVEVHLEDQVKSREDIAELARQLQSKEGEVADLKRCQQALLGIKNKEIEELKEDKECGAELDKQCAAVKSAKAASVDRSAMLEELCRQKDTSLTNLKQGILSLESKVQKSQAYQPPAVPRSRQNSTPSTPSNSGYGAPRKERPTANYASSPPGSDPILVHIGKSMREVSNSDSLHRNPPHIDTQRQEEITDDARSEQETSQEYSSAPGSTTIDNFSVNSLASSENEVESQIGSEYCSSGDYSRHHNSEDRHFTTGASSHNRTLQFKKFASSGLRRSAATSTASSVRGLKRVQPSRIFSSVTSRSQLASGRMHSTIPLSRTLSYKPKKAMKGRNSPQIKNSKTLRPKSANMATNYRSSSSIDMSFKANVSPGHITLGSSAGSVDSLDRLAIKRKRWM